MKRCNAREAKPSSTLCECVQVSVQHNVMDNNLSFRPELKFIAKPEWAWASLSNSLLLPSLLVTFLPGWISQSSLQPALWSKILAIPPTEDVVPVWLSRASLPLCASLT